MNERPILFSAPMVRAILDGRKTQTRRLVAGPAWSADDTLELHDDGLYAVAKETGCLSKVPLRFAPGDELWVREAWRASKDYDAYPPREMSRWPVHYEADGAPDPNGELHMNGRLRPSIHMPRWASRITLRVTGVKVEQLQNISEADAVAEGCAHHHDPGGDGQNVVEQFSYLWQSIHGPGSWDANPWVAAITFEREK